jgi:chemotaxis protein MotB
MMPPKRHREEENVDNWLMSYADMITLLLAFFVIFISISEPKKEKMQAVTESMSGKFGTIDLSTPFQGAYKTLLALIERDQLLKDMAIERTQNGLRMELSSGAFFKKNSTQFAEDKQKALQQLADAIKGISFLDYRVAIEGHSNDFEPVNTVYPSNWEFTSAQASHLARFLVKQGIDASRIKVTGYADTKPKVPNRDADGNAIWENQLLNARIEIVVERQL